MSQLCMLSRRSTVTPFLAIALATLGLASRVSASEPELEIRIIYDNTSVREDVPEDWGFGAVITFRVRRVLFDSGTKPDLFMKNLAAMDVEPSSIERAVISHQHPDHRSGLLKLFPAHPSLKVHFLEAFEPDVFREAKSVGMKPFREMRPYEVVPGIYSTGMLTGDPPEQSLIIETSKGLVVVVGCSHPGITKIVDAVERQRGKDSVRLLLGGLHMFRQQEAQIRPQIRRLRDLKVQGVMPAHCSGDLAKQLFAEAYGDGFEPLGAGKVLRLE